MFLLALWQSLDSKLITKIIAAKIKTDIDETITPTVNNFTNAEMHMHI